MFVTISNSRLDKHSFLVALISMPELPKGLTKNKIYTQCAVVAVNDENGNGIFSAVCLNGEEKSVIGYKLADSCSEFNKWYYCNMYAGFYEK